MVAMLRMAAQRPLDLRKRSGDIILPYSAHVRVRRQAHSAAVAAKTVSAVASLSKK
jgi:hypothetical protein